MLRFPHSSSAIELKLWYENLIYRARPFRPLTTTAYQEYFNIAIKFLTWYRNIWKFFKILKYFCPIDRSASSTFPDTLELPMRFCLKRWWRLICSRVVFRFLDYARIHNVFCANTVFRVAITYLWEHYFTFCHWIFFSFYCWWTISPGRYHPPRNQWIGTDIVYFMFYLKFTVPK